jgi:hypothetical protein
MIIASGIIVTFWSPFAKTLEWTKSYLHALERSYGRLYLVASLNLRTYRQDEHNSGICNLPKQSREIDTCYFYLFTFSSPFP